MPKVTLKRIELLLVIDLLSYITKWREMYGRLRRYYPVYNHGGYSYITLGIKDSISKIDTGEIILWESNDYF